jgi:hypothetical protein
MNKLTLESKTKYFGAIGGMALCFSILVAADTGALKITQTDFYKGCVVACATSLKIIKPKYKAAES